jgi:hypothetical protein
MSRSLQVAITCLAIRASAEPAAEPFHDCMLRRDAMIKEAEHEEDADMRAKIMADLPHCTVGPLSNPVTTESGDCKEARRQAALDAMRITSEQERGRALAALPVCEPGDAAAATAAHTDQAPPTVTGEEESAYGDGPELAAAVGWTAWSGTNNLPSGTGPLVLVEGGWRWRGVSLLGFGEYARFSGSLGQTIVASGVAMIESFHFTESVTIAGVRARIHLGQFGFGAGVSSVYRQTTATNPTARTDYDDTLVMLEGDLSYAVLAATHFRLEAIAGFGVATGTDTSTSARVGIAGRL